MADEARRAAPAPPTRLQRARKAYALVGDILTPQRLLVLLAALALLGISLIGGWESATATDDETPVIQAGEAHGADPFEITVTGVRFGDELPGVVLPWDGHRYLFVVAEVTNTSTDPVPASLLGRSVTLEADGLMALANGSPFAPEIHRINDSLTATTYQPGVPTPSVLSWRQSSAEPVPDEVGVTLNAFTWRHSVVEDREYWFDEAPSARLTLPVQELGS